MHVADVVGASYAAFTPAAATQQGEAYVAPQPMHVTHRTGKRLLHAITECVRSTTVNISTCTFLVLSGISSLPVVLYALFLRWQVLMMLEYQGQTVCIMQRALEASLYLLAFMTQDSSSSSSNNSNALYRLNRTGFTL
jgi:hypothetical protein